MSNALSLFRSLMIFGFCLPLAIYIGYLLATPDASNIVTIAIILILMTVPMLLRWHHLWLVFFWNMGAYVFFLPGKLQAVYFLIWVSLGISIVQSTLSRDMKFIRIPSLARPIYFLLGVVLITSRLTGGIRFNSVGDEDGVVGGKKYLLLITGLIGFFALSAQKIPANKAKLYIRLYFIGTIIPMLCNLAYVISPVFSFVLLVFPSDATFLLMQDMNIVAGPTGGITRLAGTEIGCLAVISWLLATHGVAGVMEIRKYWRLLIFLVAAAGSLLGGFRSMFIAVSLLFAILFYLEGLVRSRLMPILIVAVLFIGALIVPFADRLPQSMQRTLSFLPIIKVDSEAAMNAAASSEWRLQMWKDVLPEVPNYLLLGKGLAINRHDLDTYRGAARLSNEGTSEMAALAGDYHNGPLSVILPFGLFGVAGLLWFWWAALKALLRNYRFGAPELIRINRYLLAYFVMKIIMFLLIFGSFYTDTLDFCGILGLSIALNGGVAEPAEAPAPQPIFNRFRLAGAASR